MCIAEQNQFLENDLKHKDFKSGDKSDVKALIGSLYGLYHVDNHWFVQAVASYGEQKVKMKQRSLSKEKLY